MSSKLKQELKDVFGLSLSKPCKELDAKKLFVKGGISVIASLAGVGKTTFMLSEKKIWESIGYSVSYVNCDSSPTIETDLIESPSNLSDVDRMFTIIKKCATRDDIIIIDSLKAMASYCGYDIENNHNMYELMLKLRTIVKETNCSIILVHHVYEAKNLRNPPINLYGSRAIEEQSDSSFIYQKDKVKIVKSRLGYSREEIVLI